MVRRTLALWLATTLYLPSAPHGDLRPRRVVADERAHHDTRPATAEPRHRVHGVRLEEVHVAGREVPDVPVEEELRAPSCGVCREKKLRTFFAEEVEPAILEDVQVALVADLSDPAIGLGAFIAAQLR